MIQPVFFYTNPKIDRGVSSIYLDKFIITLFMPIIVIGTWFFTKHTNMIRGEFHNSHKKHSLLFYINFIFKYENRYQVVPLSEQS